MSLTEYALKERVAALEMAINQLCIGLNSQFPGMTSDCDAAMRVITSQASILEAVKARKMNIHRLRTGHGYSLSQPELRKILNIFIHQLLANNLYSQTVTEVSGKGKASLDLTSMINGGFDHLAVDESNTQFKLVFELDSTNKLIDIDVFHRAMYEGNLESYYTPYDETICPIYSRELLRWMTKSLKSIPQSNSWINICSASKGDLVCILAQIRAQLHSYYDRRYSNFDEETLAITLSTKGTATNTHQHHVNLIGEDKSLVLVYVLQDSDANNFTRASRIKIQLSDDTPLSVEIMINNSLPRNCLKDLTLLENLKFSKFLHFLKQYSISPDKFKEYHDSSGTVFDVSAKTLELVDV